MARNAEIWEYEVKKVECELSKYGETDLKVFLNDMGNKGWEMINMNWHREEK